MLSINSRVIELAQGHDRRDTEMARMLAPLFSTLSAKGRDGQRPPLNGCALGGLLEQVARCRSHGSPSRRRSGPSQGGSPRLPARRMPAHVLMRSRSAGQVRSTRRGGRRGRSDRCPNRSAPNCIASPRPNRWRECNGWSEMALATREGVRSTPESADVGVASAST
jgi:hypothetical protein